ncbi:hypothetical protein ACROYT_G027981 [Oculina patagonica]
MAEEKRKLVVIAVSDHKPNEEDDLESQQAVDTAPDLSAQLSVTHGEKFEVLGRDVDWWLYVKHINSGEKGYIPSTCVVPLKDDLTNEEENEIDKGSDLTAALVNTSVDLKFFPDAPVEAETRKPCPEDSANILSRLSFFWLSRLIFTGFKRPLLDADLWALNKSNRSSTIVPPFIKKWKEVENSIRDTARSPTVEPIDNEKAELKADDNGDEEVKFSSENQKKKKPSLSRIMFTLFWDKFLLAVFFKLINDCIQFVQPELLRLLIEHVEDKDDLDVWRGYVYGISMFVVALVQSVALQQYFRVIFSLGMKVRAAVIGMVYSKALLLNNNSRKESTAGEMVNLMSVDAQRLMDLLTYVKQMGAKDLRIKMINEILNGIKVLKLYAWETSFMKMVSKHRKKELRHIKNASYLDSIFNFTYICAPFMVSLATFAIYVLIGNELTASKAFVAISLFNILRFPLVALPNVIISLIQAQVSLKRLTDFLSLQELDPDNVEKSIPDHISTQAIHIENGAFSWDANGKPTLTDINVNISSGSLVAVVGQVGCGKSTLLSALLGETEKLDGKVYVKGSVAYVPQIAWIQNATLRENILFGRSFDSKRYAKAIHTCALQPDLDILPGGDLTEIGEKGINLSGGQKQRVSLARSVYFNADIYLLDDPLSAVDSHVGKHIFDKVIGPRGKLRKKATEDPVPEAIMEDIDDVDGGSSARQSTEMPHNKREDSISVVTGDTADLDCQFTRPDQEGDKMIEEEKSQTGNVKLSVFWEYAKSLTVPFSVCIICFFLFSEAASVSSGIWLAKWSSTDVASNKERDLFLGVYGGLGLSQGLFVLMAYLSMAEGSRTASRHLHHRLLVNIMHSPMSFFETTPQGRIMNRFSKDISGIDGMVPMCLNQFLRTFLNVIGIMFAICFVTPIFLAVIIPVGALYLVVQRIYVASSRQLKRIESVSRSPIYNNFLETINGTTTIRAFAQQQRFIRGNYFLVDENQVAYYPSVMANRWLAVHLEFVGNLMILFAALFAVVNRDSLASGLVGLSITYALRVTSTLSWMVRMTSEVETNIVSVERVKEYSETPTEAEWIIPDNRPPDGWPDAGNIVIEEFDLKYREGLPLVLKQINCDIKPGEKVGIVGRTGAGKSTLTLALFRILERAGGRIVVDGVDIAKIGLQDLRSRLTIIPQDPVLFSGTLRLNLDPFDSHTDEELWKILEMSHLKNFVSGLEEGLLYPVSEGGENLSVGQRQLVCLARALLRKSKILVLDEATAAVDLETDELIQQTIRREFADRTVFTIAHRLNTIMDYTRIIVLDRGFMMEFDTPQALLAQQGIFYNMARDAGLA